MLQAIDFCTLVRDHFGRTWLHTQVAAPLGVGERAEVESVQVVAARHVRLSFHLNLYFQSQGVSETLSEVRIRNVSVRARPMDTLWRRKQVRDRSG